MKTIGEAEMKKKWWLVWAKMKRECWILWLILWMKLMLFERFYYMRKPLRIRLDRKKNEKSEKKGLGFFALQLRLTKLWGA
jgi:hypothetical protein